jgi:hypothetical protein
MLILVTRSASYLRKVTLNKVCYTPTERYSTLYVRRLTFFQTLAISWTKLASPLARVFITSSGSAKLRLLFVADHIPCYSHRSAQYRYGQAVPNGGSERTATLTLRFDAF